MTAVFTRPLIKTTIHHNTLCPAVGANRRRPAHQTGVRSRDDQTTG